MDSSLATERDNQEVSTALNQLQNISIAILKQFAEVRNELRGMRGNITAIMDSVHTLNASVQEQYSDLQNQLQNKYDGLQNQYDGLQNQYDGLQNQYDGLQNQYNTLQRQIEYTSTRSDVQDIERRQLQLHVDILRFQASSTERTTNLQLEVEELANRFPHEFHESLSSLNESLVSKLMMLSSLTAITENTMESKLQQQTNALESILIASSQNVSQELREKTECVKELVTEKSRDLIAEIQTHSQQLTCPLPIPQSCTKAMWFSGALQGVHTIQNSTGQTVSVYCTTQSRCCNTAGAWTRVAYLDMTDSTHICPQGFTLRTDHGKRTCGRITGRGCTSITYTTHGLQYSRVCGRIIAYQYSSPDGFHTLSRDSIDDTYVHGVSITHGENPRKHIWTFTAALDETRANRHTCPCTRTDLTYTGSVPTFIGNDYFCETGSRQHFQFGTFYHEDPLWDGEGCGPNSSCCTFNSPPWFCKHLPHPTTDDIEVRVCGDQDVNNEDTPLEQVELYIQ